MSTTDDEPWQRYELSVQKLLAALDPNSEVIHNHRVKGRYSDVSRQVDVWVTGYVAGIEHKVAVECKRYRRPLDVSTVDEFVGKLLDLDADRGILYAYSGFTNAAVRRALTAGSPRIVTIAVQTPEIVRHNFVTPGYPADLLAQDWAPQWIEEMSAQAFARFLSKGEWTKFWG